MANHKSAIKRARQNKKRRIRNRVIRSEFRTEMKKYSNLILENKIEEAQNQLPKIHKIIDKTQIKGIIPKNTASRNKSRISIMLNKALNPA